MKRLLFFLGFLAIIITAVCPHPGMATEAVPDGAAEEKCVAVSSVQVDGNQAFSAFRLKLRLKTWSKSLLPWANECLNDDWLERDIKNLVTFYRKKGYADVTIEPEVVARDGGRKNILVLHIAEGLRYKLDFQGADHFNGWQLKSEVEIKKKGNLNDGTLKRGVRNIEKRYRKAGFPDAVVAYEKVKQTDGGKSFWQVTFTIEEKGRWMVSSVAIRGNDQVDEKEIRQAMLTKPKTVMGGGGFSKKTLNEDIQTIEQLYRSRGLRNIEVTRSIDQEAADGASDGDGEDRAVENGGDGGRDPETWVSIVLTMEEGEKVLVSDARITGIDGLFTEEALMTRLSLKPGNPFRDYMIKSDANIIASLVSEKGYPHTTVEGRFELDDTGHGARVAWEVDRGVLTRVGEISYLGNNKLKESIMAAQLDITPGELFSLKKVTTAPKKLRRINAVKTVKIQSPDLQEEKDVADLEVVIEEKNPYYVETAIGYDTERLQYLMLEVGDTNFLGRDIRSYISTEVSSIGYKAEAGLKDPFFLQTDMTAASKVYFEKEEALNHDFGVKAWGASGTVSKPITEKLSVGIGLSYENRTRYGDETAYADYDGDDLGDQYESRNIFVTSLFATYDSRDSAVRPRSGIFASAYTDIYTGIDNNLDRFVKYSLDIRGYHTVWERVTFALRSRFGHIQPFDTGSAIAEDQLFFLGGTTNVRGFDENMLVFDGSGDPSGGKTMAHGTVESRIAITNAIELSLFLDAGQVKDMADNSRDRGLRSTVGMGFNYITPIGPLSLMYGYKLDREENESAGEVHFSIGYTF